MSVGFYDSFLHSWNSKPINFYYLRPQIKTYEIAKGTSSFQSETLFLDMKLPYKLTVGLVLTMAFKGKYGYSPFFFQRVFQKEEQEESEFEVDEDDFDDDFEVLEPQPSKGKGKNKSKKGRKTFVNMGFDAAKRALGRDISPTPSTSSLPSYEQTLRRRGQGDSRRYNRKNRSLDKAIGAPVWIKKMSLLLNGKPLNDFDYTGTLESGAADFLRMQVNNSMLYGALSNGIGMDDFEDGYAIVSYSLTAAPFDTNQSIPQVKQGVAKLQLEFSGPLPVSATLICHSLFPSLITIDKDRSIHTSYST